MVLESACRFRTVTPEEMKAFRRSWGRARARALWIVDPNVMPQGSDISAAFNSFPKMRKLRPAGVYRAIEVSKRNTSVVFANDLWGVAVVVPPGSAFLRCT